ncbi:MAG: site-2 protease family protein, partial [Peptoniphilus harei]|nr:site-2 protease family protein [Peptoniphilus harei]
MITLISSLLVFLLVVMLHEFGHFSIAKLSGIKVNEFSIGMGPKIYQKQ